MAQIRFYVGNRARLPAQGASENALYFCIDEGKLFQTKADLSLVEYTDVVEVSSLPASGIQGKLYVNTTDSTLHRWNGTQWVQLSGSASTFTATSSDVLENKTIDASQNTISNLDTTHFATGVIDTDGTLSANSDLKLASQKAVKAYVDTKTSSIVGGLEYVGLLDASNLGTQLDDAQKGNFFKVSVAGTILTSLVLEVGDMLIINKDVVGTPTLADIDVIDNTESADLLRDADVSTNTDLTVDGDKIINRTTLKTVIENYIAWQTF